MSYTTLKTTEAQRIADSLYEKDAQKEIETAQWLLIGQICELNGSSKHVTFEPFLEYRGFLIEMACLLSNPDISSKMQEDYYKEHSSRIIKNLFHFFDYFIGNDDVHKYLTWYNLKHFSASISPEELQYIKQCYKF